MAYGLVHAVRFDPSGSVLTAGLAPTFGGGGEECCSQRSLSWKLAL